MSSNDSAYAEFMKEVNEYYRLFNTGLKKQGNVNLKEFSQKFRRRPIDERYEVLNEFCRFVCDTEEGKTLLERGNGELPYELKLIVCEYLQEECRQNEMPHLRWYYELFKNSPEVYENGAPDIVDILKRAYVHNECDEKTIKFYYIYWLNLLSWGAHHFPEGCIIDKQDYDLAFDNCNKIASEHTVPENLLAEAVYFRKLYNAWECYLSEGKKRSFEYYCAQAGIDT